MIEQVEEVFYAANVFQYTSNLCSCSEERQQKPEYLDFPLGNNCRGQELKRQYLSSLRNGKGSVLLKMTGEE